MPFWFVLDFLDVDVMVSKGERRIFTSVKLRSPSHQFVFEQTHCVRNLSYKDAVLIFTFTYLLCADFQDAR